MTVAPEDVPQATVAQATNISRLPPLGRAEKFSHDSTFREGFLSYSRNNKHTGDVASSGTLGQGNMMVVVLLRMR